MYYYSLLWLGVFQEIQAREINESQQQEFPGIP